MIGGIWVKDTANESIYLGEVGKNCSKADERMEDQHIRRIVNIKYVFTNESTVVYNANLPINNQTLMS